VLSANLGFSRHCAGLSQSWRQRRFSIALSLFQTVAFDDLEPQTSIAALLKVR
jgi:hypothetical protein